jgi:hypothetical protein
MLRRIALPALLLWAGFSAMACMDASQHLTVASDGSATLSTRILIDKSVLQTLGDSQISVDQMVASARQSNPDATVTGVTTAKQTGVQVTARYKTIDEALAALRGEKRTSARSDTSILFKRAGRSVSTGFLTRTESYSFATEAPSGSATSSQGSSAQAGGLGGLGAISGQMRALLQSEIKLTFALTLPGKIARATGGARLSEDGRTATWDIPFDQSTSFSVTSEPIGPPLLPVGMAVVALLVVAAGAAGAGVLIWRNLQSSGLASGQGVPAAAQPAPPPADPGS